MTCSVTVSLDINAEISAREIGSILPCRSYVRTTFPAVRDENSQSVNGNVVAPTATRRNVIKVNG